MRWDAPYIRILEYSKFLNPDPDHWIGRGWHRDYAPCFGGRRIKRMGYRFEASESGTMLNGMLHVNSPIGHLTVLRV